MTGLAKNTAAMNRAGAACGCGALIYLAARSLLTRLASLLLALRVDEARLGEQDVGPLLVALSPTPVSDGGGYRALVGPLDGKDGA